MRVSVLGAIAAGGGVGALARYGVQRALPAVPGGFPWATFGINVGGCCAIGVLMVVILERRTAHRLTRPFLGVGVLGGFTTFSSYAVDVDGLLRHGDVATALGYLAATPVAAVVACAVGMRAAR